MKQKLIHIIIIAIFLLVFPHSLCLSIWLCCQWLVNKVSNVFSSPVESLNSNSSLRVCVCMCLIKIIIEYRYEFGLFMMTMMMMVLWNERAEEIFAAHVHFRVIPASKSINKLPLITFQVLHRIHPKMTTVQASNANTLQHPSSWTESKQTQRQQKKKKNYNVDGQNSFRMRTQSKMHCTIRWALWEILCVVGRLRERRQRQPNTVRCLCSWFSVKTCV